MLDAASLSQSLEARGPCPICRADETSTRHAFEPIPVVTCGPCGFTYSHRVMSDAALAEYYTGEFASDRLRQGQEVVAGVGALGIRRLVGDLRGKSVLDVGAGYGFLMALLRDHYGAQVIGVEPSTEEVAFARDELNLDVRPVFLSDSGLPEASYDVVISSEVIEHIPQPVSFVEEISRYVKPGGTLVLVTDNFDSAVVRKMGPRFPKWIPHVHISHFNGSTLKRCIEQVDGLNVDGQISYTPWELHALAVKAGRRPEAPAAECFDLGQALAKDQGGRFRLFRFRKFVNRLWFKTTAKSDTRGEMMFMKATRHAPA